MSDAKCKQYFDHNANDNLKEAHFSHIYLQLLSFHFSSNMSNVVVVMFEVMSPKKGVVGCSNTQNKLK